MLGCCIRCVPCRFSAEATVTISGLFRCRQNHIDHVRRHVVFNPYKDRSQNKPTDGNRNTYNPTACDCFFVLVYNLGMLLCSKRPLWLRFINVVSPARREPMALSGPTYNSGGAGITGHCDRHERCFRDCAIFLALPYGLGRE